MNEGAAGLLTSRQRRVITSGDDEALLPCRLQLIAIKFFRLLRSVLVNGVHHEKDPEAFLPQSLKERRRRHCRDALTCDVKDVVLVLFHSFEVLLEA